MTSQRTTALSLALFLLTGACTQILGVEDARIDSSLSPATGGGSGDGALSESGAQNHGGDAARGGSSPGASGRSSLAGAKGSLGGDDSATAGATGDSDACQSYCTAVVNNCTGKYEQYRTTAQCMEVCKQLPPGATGDESVNTVECRARQAFFAES
ncbi:MAG TPA: hypothetical protein VGL19_11130, partial [Polyangiaceae bacterium]